MLGSSVSWDNGNTTNESAKIIDGKDQASESFANRVRPIPRVRSLELNKTQTLEDRNAGYLQQEFLTKMEENSSNEMHQGDEATNGREAENVAPQSTENKFASNQTTRKILYRRLTASSCPTLLSELSSLAKNHRIHGEEPWPNTDHPSEDRTTKRSGRHGHSQSADISALAKGPSEKSSKTPLSPRQRTKSLHIPCRSQEFQHIKDLLEGIIKENLDAKSAFVKESKANSTPPKLELGDISKKMQVKGSEEKSAGKDQEVEGNESHTENKSTFENAKSEVPQNSQKEENTVMISESDSETSTTSSTPSSACVTPREYQLSPRSIPGSPRLGSPRSPRDYASRKSSLGLVDSRVPPESPRNSDSYYSQFMDGLKMELSPLDPRLAVYTKKDEKKKKTRWTMQNDNEMDRMAQLKYDELQAMLSQHDVLVAKEDLVLGEKIGKKTYKSTLRGKTVMARKIKHLSIPENALKRQIATLQKCNHPNVTVVLGGCIDPPCVIYEYLEGGNLHRVLHKKKVHLDMLLMVKMGKQIALGMNHLHSLGILHKDLSSKMVLLDESRNAKVLFKLPKDFSRMKKKSKDSVSGDDLRLRPPEITKGEKNYNEKVDVYAYGFFLWEMLTGKVPFGKLDSVAAAAKAAYENLRPKISRSCPVILKKLIMCCWAPDPNDRPSFQEILKFFKHLEGKLFFSSLGGFWTLDKEQELLKERRKQEKFEEIVSFLKKKNFIVPYEELTLGNKIGEGSYAKVWEAKWNDYRVAVKKLKNKNITEKFFMREISSLSASRHPNIVLFLGACIKPACIITEFMAGGSLYEVLHVQKVKVEIPMVLKMAKDLGLGMVHLHSNNIIHRDLTSKNILLDEFQNVKICDFGLSRDLEGAPDMTVAGICNPRWRPPEITKGEKNYTNKVDVYCFSLILFELVTGKLPFENMDSVTAAARAAYEGYRPSLQVCPQGLKDLIEACWADNPLARPTFEEIVERVEALKSHIPLLLRVGSVPTKEYEESDKDEEDVSGEVEIEDA